MIRRSQKPALAKDPWLAVNLSMLFPGIGQIYAGHSVKGVLWLGGQIWLGAIALQGIFSATGNTVNGLMVLLLALGVYVANLFDAYRSINPFQAPPPQRSIPAKTAKNLWFAVFLARILPGLGHLYQEKLVAGTVFMVCLVIASSAASFFEPLLILPPVISAIACYHVYATAPQSRHHWQSVILGIAIATLSVQLALSYLPDWIEQHWVERFIIPSDSMVPTLQVGDRILVQKSAQYLPKTGDLVVFEMPKTPQVQAVLKSSREAIVIKRVIGEPGQVIRIANGTVYLNDQPLQEDYIAESPNYQWGPQTIPNRTYFVLGDNRNRSFDSHIWGFLPQRQIIGRAYKIFWPPAHIRPLK